ncbi:hypothetical protein BRARA_J00798 [Brassica rapa]|uniref:DDE Tnp4 domain-containing protein n=1 Tax=Brassica campestris TaxID=3711 RepID=A0A397XJ90_BRACM|nr:hypothetical protein BRARA_J00798 [Brassica rapa]
MFLEVVGQVKTKRDISSRYQRSLDTVQRKLDDVLSALLKFVEDTLRPQESEFTRVNPVLRNDDRYWPYFRDCIGALNGTHVLQDPTMNVLAICNFDMKFLYAYLGVPGRAHDTKVLTHCARNEASFPHPPPEKYYLVDSGYPTRTGYLCPHRSLQSVIEGKFGVWKAKLRILDRKHSKYDLVKWIKLVTTTMALHNFMRVPGNNGNIGVDNEKFNSPFREQGEPSSFPPRDDNVSSSESSKDVEDNSNSNGYEEDDLLAISAKEDDSGKSVRFSLMDVVKRGETFQNKTMLKAALEMSAMKHNFDYIVVKSDRKLLHI